MRYIAAFLLVWCSCLAQAGHAGAHAPLTIVSAAPEGESTAITQIMVRFSENMRPLGVMQETPENAPLKLNVPGGMLPEGNFRWLDPATLAYVFDKPVTAPFEIVASVPAGTKALSGAALAEEASWSVRTSAPIIRSRAWVRDWDNNFNWRGTRGTLSPDNNKIVLRASTALRLEDLKTHIELKTDSGILPFTIEPLEKAGFYVVTIRAEIPKDRVVTLNVRRGVRPVAGNIHADAFSFAFETYRTFEFLGWKPDLAYPDGRLVPHSSLELVFSAPVSRESLQQHLRIEPDPNAGPEKDGDLSFYSFNWLRPGFKMRFRMQPQTAYTVTLGRGLEDEYGQRLDKDVHFQFSTGDLASNLFSRYGYILEAGLGGVFPLYVSNVSPVDVRLHFYPGDSDLPFFDAFPPAMEAEGVVGLREYRTQLDFSSRWNQRNLYLLNLSDGLGDLRNGSVWMNLSFDRVDTNGQKERENFWHWPIQQTDLGLSTHVGREGGIAWVTGIADAHPVANASIEIFSEDGKRLWQSVTNRQGVARLPGLDSVPASKPHYVVARKDGDRVVMKISAPSDWGKAWDVHMVTQRPVYQLGETVRFTLFARRYAAENSGEAERWRPLPAGTMLSYVVTEENGKEIYRGRAQTNAYGSISGSFDLPADAALGEYRVSVGQEGVEAYPAFSFFRVASFRLPEFKVSVTPPERPVVASKMNRIMPVIVSSAYFSGMPTKHAKLRMRVHRETLYRAKLPVLEGWNVGVSGRKEKHSLLVEPDGMLDAAGNAEVRLPALKVDPGEAASISLEATVADAADITSQGTARFVVYPSSRFVGLRMSYIGQVGKPSLLMLKAADIHDRSLVGVRVRLKVLRSLPSGKDDEALWEKEVELTEPSGTPVFIPFDREDVYRVVAIIRDEHGRENMTETYHEVYDQNEGVYDWSRSRATQEIVLDPDAPSYLPGETALITVRNTLLEEGETAPALIVISRNGVKDFRIEQLTGPVQVIPIPLSAAYAPSVSVSVHLVKGRTAPPPVTGEDNDLSIPFHTYGKWRVDTGAPMSLSADVSLRIAPPDTGLQVAVHTDAERYRPGGNVKAQVAVRNAHGKGNKAQVTLLAVDARALRAAGENTLYDPSATFTPRLAAALQLKDVRDQLLNWSGHPLRSGPQGVEIPYEEAGGGRPRSEGEPIRENFAPDAYWLAEAQTNDEGMLVTEFTLPDALTSYRIVAVAADTHGEFGTAEREIQTDKPLQLVSALPRFATEGDELMAQVLVQNRSEASTEVTVSAAASGMTLTGDSSRIIRLGKGESGTVRFPLRMTSPGEAVLRVHGSMPVGNAEEKDAAAFRLPVLPAAPMTTVAAAGMLKTGEKYSMPVRLPASLDPRSRLDVILAPSPAAGLMLTAQDLLDYPWHCAEQRLSRIWVRALRLNNGELMGLPAEPEADRKNIVETWQALPYFQKKDGGFALWKELQRSDLYLTTYVLLVNKELEPLNIGLEKETVSLALNYLASAVSDTEKFDPDSRAMALWMLARYKGHAEKIRQVFPGLRDEFLAGKGNPLGLSALLLMLHEQHDLPDGEYAKTQLMNALEKNLTVTATQMHFRSQNRNSYWQTMGSRLRDNGMVLWMLSSTRPDYPRLEALAFWVSQGLGEARQLSTQEAIYGLLGMTAFLRQLDGSRPVRLKADWNGKDSVIRSFSRLIDPPETWRIAADKLEGGGEGRLQLGALEGNPYWTARLRYASPLLPMQPENAGMTLERSWDRPGPYGVGDRVDVTVTLTVPASRRHVLLFDPFPAGFEPLHASRADLQGEDIERTGSGGRYWQRQELREDGVLLYASQLPPGVYAFKYRLRAVAPGRFVRRQGYAEEMYAPEVFGRTAGETVEVRLVE